MDASDFANNNAGGEHSRRIGFHTHFFPRWQQFMDDNAHNPLLVAPFFVVQCSKERIPVIMWVFNALYRVVVLYIVDLLLFRVKETLSGACV